MFFVSYGEDHPLTKMIIIVSVLHFEKVGSSFFFFIYIYISNIGTCLHYRRPLSVANGNKDKGDVRTYSKYLCFHITSINLHKQICKDFR